MNAPTLRATRQRAAVSDLLDRLADWTANINDFINGNVWATYMWPDGFWQAKNHEKLQGVIGSRPPLPGGRPDLGQALDEWMAHIGGRRAAETVMGGRLEGEQSQKVIHIGPHLRRAAGPPGPNRRADIIDDGNLRRALPDGFGDPVGEIRTVDDDEHVGLCRNNRIGREADALQNRRQPRDDRGDAHHGNLFERELDEILASPRAVSIREGFSRRRAVEELCRRCGYARRF